MSANSVFGRDIWKSQLTLNMKNGRISPAICKTLTEYGRYQTHLSEK